MTWDGAIKTIVTAIVSFGGAGAIIIWAAKKASDVISEQLMQKYESKLNKEIEYYKHTLEM